jgi:hypothetical protein
MKTAVIRAIAIGILPLFSFFSATNCYANIPEFAKILEIIRPNNLGIRARGKLTPVGQDAIIKKYEDNLYFPGDGKTFARLGFYNKSGQDIGLTVQASTKNKLITFYYFPCSIWQGDAVIIEWANQKGGKRGCERGIRIRTRNNKKDAWLENNEYIFTANNKQNYISQVTPSGFKYYCSVIASDGRTWFGVSSSDTVCDEPLQTCQTNKGNNCELISLDRWSLREKELTVSVDCTNKQQFVERTSGADVAETLTKLWQKAQNNQAKSCSIHTVNSSEEIVIPISNERTIIESHTDNDFGCNNLDIITGNALVKTSQKPEGVLLKKG